MNIKYENKNIIGADETGVGDYLTPLVACAVFVSAENVKTLIDAGVVDSKLLSDKQIRVIANKIKPLVKYSTRIMSQAQYNFLTDNKKYNAHELKSLLHLKAINSLEERVSDIDLIIIDAFASQKNIESYFAKLIKFEDDIVPIKNEVKYIEKGESEHVAVAAASIIARLFLLDEMEKQTKEWSCEFPLGTNSRVENAAKIFVQKHGKSALYKVAKLSFKTTTKIL